MPTVNVYANDGSGQVLGRTQVADPNVTAVQPDGSWADQAGTWHMASPGSGQAGIDSQVNDLLNAIQGMGPPPELVDAQVNAIKSATAVSDELLKVAKIGEGQLTSYLGQFPKEFTAQQAGEPGFTGSTQPEVAAALDVQSALRRKQVSQLLADALTGKAPVDPALEQELQRRAAISQEGILRDLGPTGASSSAGILRGQATAQEADIARSDARQKYTALLASILSGSPTTPATSLNPLSALTSAGQGYSGVAGDIGNAIAGYQREQSILGNLGFQGIGIAQQGLANQEQALANMFAFNQIPPARGGGFDPRSLIGPAITAGGTIGAAALSTARAKRAIRPLTAEDAALVALRATPLFRYRYRWEHDADRVPHLGPLLELSPAVIREDAAHVNVLDYAGLTHAGLKALDKKVARLEARMGRALVGGR